MIKFEIFEFAWTYEMAGFIRMIIFEEDKTLVDITDHFGETDEKFISRSIKPSKYTHLHDLIDISVSTYLSETRNNDFEDELQKILVAYQIPIGNNEDLADLVYENVVPRITEEVFTILYSDRELLLRLNEIISRLIKRLSAKNHPKLLSKDGVVHRCKYWNKWLQNAVLYRDKGRCCLCNSDISGLLVSGAETHMDHIVPLHLGGTNDPTNLQLLCEKCNKEKGGGQGKTTGRQFLYW